MKLFFVPWLLIATAQAATISQMWDLSEVVPDNDFTGWTDTRIVTTPLTSISLVEVHLKISGGLNGDLYAYLRHDTGFSVLLNRVGRTELNPDGSFTSGMDVTFTTGANEDIHNAGIFSGEFLSDGRETSSSAVLDTDSRTATLSSFNGLDPNGEWTLLVADVSPVFQSTVESWGITIHSTPEWSSMAGTGLLLAGVLFRRSRRS